jgi:hypothetical protein
MIYADDKAEELEEVDPEVSVGSPVEVPTPPALPPPPPEVPVVETENGRWVNTALEAIPMLKERQQGIGWYKEAEKRSKGGLITEAQFVSIREALVKQFPPQPVKGEQLVMPIQTVIPGEAVKMYPPPETESKPEPEPKKARKPKPARRGSDDLPFPEKIEVDMREAQTVGSWMALRARVEVNTTITEEEKAALLEKVGEGFKEWKAASSKGELPF